MRPLPARRPGLRRRQEETRRARAPTGNATCEFDVKVCDRLLFGEWSGNEVKIDGQELLIMKESDIMGR